MGIRISGSGSGTTSNVQGYLYNSQTGLQKWNAALANLDANRNSIIDVAVIGDSITEGWGPTVYGWDMILNAGYVGVLGRIFGRRYQYCPGSILYGYPYSGGGVWTPWNVVSGWASSTPSGEQPYMPFGLGITSSGNISDKLTLKFVGNGVGVLAVNDQTNGGNYQWSVDGGSNTTVSLNSNSGVSVLNSVLTSALTYGEHTLTITADNTSGKYSTILGAYPIVGQFGVRFHRVAAGGRTSTDAQTGCTQMIDALKPSLTIIAFLANDYSTQMSLSTYQSNVQNLITEGQKYGDVLLLSVGVENQSYTTPQSQYVSVLKNLATSNNCAFLDIFSRWNGTTPTYALNTTKFLSSDNVHPTVQGHLDVAQAVTEALLGNRESSIGTPQTSYLMPAPPSNNVNVVKSETIINSGAIAGGTAGWICTTSGVSNSVPWSVSTAYQKGQMVNANGNVYGCGVAGTSASSGTGPSGTGGSGIVDNTCQWWYVGPLAVWKTNGTIGS